MTSLIKLASIGALIALSFPAIADPLVDTVTTGNQLSEAPVEWLGEAPHIVIMGTVKGYRFDFQLLDIDAADLHRLEVKREYLLTDTGYSPYQEIDLGIQLVLDGVEKGIEAKITHADFHKVDAPPSVFQLQSAEEHPNGNQVFAEFEFEWEGGGVSVNQELSEWTGTATIGLDDARGADQPHGDGFVGAFLQAANGDDTLTISFTLAVTEFEVDD